MRIYKQGRSLMAVLAIALLACGEASDDEANDELSQDDDATQGDDDQADGDDDDGKGGDAATASTKDAATATTEKDAGAVDAGTKGSSDASRARDGSTGVSDAGSSRNDAAAATSGGDGGAVASGNDVPSGEHCAAVAAWDAQAAAFEQQVLELTNAARAAGHNCDTEGMFAATGPLKMEPRLRCSARLHSKYMAEKGEFAHTESASGDDPFKRMQAAGYQFQAAGENIAAGQTTPKQVVDGWLNSDGHCANIMNSKFTELGVGYMVAARSTGPGGRGMPYWTQNFGRPR